MLKFLRRHARSTTIKVLFWVIIAVFVLWGVGTFTGGDRATYAASVNGQSISPAEIRRQALRLERLYRELYGENLSPEVLKALDLKSRALEQRIEAELLAQEARRLGLEVTDEELARDVASIEGLRENGVLQRERYLRFLRSQGLTPAEFEEERRRALLIDKLRELVVRSVRRDEETARRVWAFQNETVNLRFVRAAASAFFGDVAPSPDEIEKFYQENRETFREPERVRIEAIVYDVEAFAEQVRVSDEEIQKEYEASRAVRYTRPEEVHARHILLRVPQNAGAQQRAEVRERARQILERLRQGEDFAALATRYSEDPATKDQGGDLGFFPRGRMEENFERAAFGLEPGGVSDLVETRYGIHIVRVEEKRPERVLPLEEVRDEIVSRLKMARAREAARDAAFDDSQLALAGKPLGEIAAARGLRVQTPPPFAEHDSVAGLPRTPDLAKQAFSTAAGSVGPVLQGERHFVVYRVAERIPSRVPELDEIRDRVERALREKMASVRAREVAEEIHREVRSGASLEEAARRRGLSVDETGPFRREGAYVPKIGSIGGLKEKAFGLSAAAPLLPEVVTASGDAFVIVWKERQQADPADFEKKKTEIVDRWLETQRNAAWSALLQDLKRRAEIRVNPAALAGA